MDVGVACSASCAWPSLQTRTVVARGPACDYGRCLQPLRVHCAMVEGPTAALHDAAQHSTPQAKKREKKEPEVSSTYSAINSAQQGVCQLAFIWLAHRLARA
jgi:hypothetical protein